MVQEDIELLHLYSEDEEMIESDEGEPSQMTQADPKEFQKLCMICTENSPDVLFLPCQHMKCCNVCIEKIKMRQPEIKCPECDTIVSQCIIPKM